MTTAAPSAPLATIRAAFTDPERLAIDLALGERTDGPVFLAGDGRRLDRHGAGRLVRKVARRAGIAKTVTPRTLRHAFITATLDAGVAAAGRARVGVRRGSADHDPV
jgi:site-specific recombinase XerD